VIVEYIKGSILDAPQKYIAHGCNAQNKMGSGVAKVLYKKYPIVKEEYHRFCKGRSFKDEDNSELLGVINKVPVESDYSVNPYGADCKWVLNCFTQEFYGYDGEKYVSYDAIYDCFRLMTGSGTTKEVAIPKIGAGLAGGNWDIIKQIIDDATGDDLDVYVYYLED